MKFFFTNAILQDTQLDYRVIVVNTYADVARKILCEVCCSDHVKEDMLLFVTEKAMDVMYWKSNK